MRDEQGHIKEIWWPCPRERERERKERVVAKHMHMKGADVESSRVNRESPH